VRVDTSGREDLRVSSRSAAEESVNPLHMGSKINLFSSLEGRFAAKMGMNLVKRAPRIPRSLMVNKEVRRGVMV